MQEQNENKAEAEFLSNRTCCVCRRPDKPFQIHHIDEDHSNDDIENLAVLCVECHIQTQQKGGFVRSLSPDVVRLYNRNWREIVKLKLLPNGDLDTFSEYEAEVYFEINLTCHKWKEHYMSIYGMYIDEDTEEKIDVWDRMEEIGEHTYSELEYKKYFPLFDKTINVIIDKLQKIILMYSDVITPEFKIILMRTMRDLENDRGIYLNISRMMTIQTKEFYFKFIFSETIKNLSHLSQKAYETKNHDVHDVYKGHI